MAATPPTYNGQTNDFTGKGTTNPDKLTLPYLDQVPDPQTRAALLKIQQYINNLLAPTGGGAYASLTGPGETTTPGALTQLGEFSVQTAKPGGSGIDLAASDGEIVTMTSSDGIVGGNLASVTLSSSGAVADVNIQAGTGGGANIAVVAAGVSPGNIQLNAATLHINGTTMGFYGATPVVKPTIGGSRSGNAALADLLTHLATLGLLIDGTSP